MRSGFGLRSHYESVIAIDPCPVVLTPDADRHAHAAIGGHEIGVKGNVVLTGRPKNDLEQLANASPTAKGPKLIVGVVGARDSARVTEVEIDLIPRIEAVAAGVVDVGIPAADCLPNFAMGDVAG